MVLVDTTVWVDLLRQSATRPVAGLRRLLARNEAALCPVIYQELLQGAVNPQALVDLRGHFSAIPSLKPADWEQTYSGAAELYAKYRWQGITPRSSHDCLIAQTAIEHRVRLLHDDRDFVAMARVEPRLKLY